MLGSLLPPGYLHPPFLRLPEKGEDKNQANPLASVFRVLMPAIQAAGKRGPLSSGRGRGKRTKACGRRGKENDLASSSGPRSVVSPENEEKEEKLPCLSRKGGQISISASTGKRGKLHRYGNSYLSSSRPWRRYMGRHVYIYVPILYPAPRVCSRQWPISSRKPGHYNSAIQIPTSSRNTYLLM